MTKKGTYTKTARILRQLALVYRTRIIVNGCYWIQANYSCLP